MYTTTKTQTGCLELLGIIMKWLKNNNKVIIKAVIKE